MGKERGNRSEEEQGREEEKDGTKQKYKKKSDEKGKEKRYKIRNIIGKTYEEKKQTLSQQIYQN